MSIQSLPIICDGVLKWTPICNSDANWLKRFENRMNPASIRQVYVNACWHDEPVGACNRASPSCRRKFQ